eukprot:3144828-Pyramimonas_sp.AAC.1
MSEGISQKTPTNFHSVYSSCGYMETYDGLENDEHLDSALPRSRCEHGKYCEWGSHVGRHG